MKAKLFYGSWTGWLGLLILLIVGWFWLGIVGAGTVAVIVLALYYAIAGTSFNFLESSLGVFSLAQVVFLAVGGYTDVYLYNTYGISPWLSMLIAPVVAGVLALPIAVAGVRAGSGPVMTALITLIVAEAASPILISIGALGGAYGLYVKSPAKPTFWDMQYASGLPYARILLVLAVLFIAFLLWWKRSRWGYYTKAIKDSPEASASVGIPNARMRVLTFVLAAALIAPAGVVYAQYSLEVSSDLFLSSTALFEVIVVALVGGAVREWGALIGSVGIVLLSNWVVGEANGRPGIGPLTFAGVFLVIALIMPRGLSGTWVRLGDRFRTTRLGTFLAPITPSVVLGIEGQGVVVTTDSSLTLRSSDHDGSDGAIP